MMRKGMAPLRRQKTGVQNFFYVFLSISVAYSYNIDLEHPLVFRGPNSSFFGYSVLEHYHDNTRWVIVGAPRANSTYSSSVHSPGAVYKCRVHSNPERRCTEMDLGRGNKLRESCGKTCQGDRDDEWMGVSLARQDRADGKILACAHRWKNVYYDSEHILPHGYCSIIPPTLQGRTKPLIPCYEALEQQCDEHRKRAKELKSKSQHLNNVLMTLTPVPAPPAPKRPRLTRTVSGPATVSAAPTQITLPLNQLTGLPLGKVLTVAGAPAGTNLGSYTLLTSALSGSELVADSSNLTVLSTAAGQEGAAGAGGSAASTAFVKVVGSQFQLVTLPAGLQGLATTQSAAVQHQVGSISVVDATATIDDSQEKHQADGDDEGQPEEVKEEDGEQSAEQQ